MVEKGRSPLLAEVVQAQGGGLSAASRLRMEVTTSTIAVIRKGRALRGGRDAVEPAQSVRECAGQRAGVDLKGVEEAKDQVPRMAYRGFQLAKMTRAMAIQP